MSTALIARKDFDDAIRSRMVLAIITIFVAFASLVVAAPALFDSPDNWTSAQVLSLIVIPAETIVPIVSLVVGYMAIVGERQSGSIKVLLGFRHSRRDVVLGKLIGRSGVIALGIVVGLAIAGLLGPVLYGSFPARDFFGLLAATLLLGTVFVSLAVGVSAGSASRGKAMAIVIGIFVVFNALWDLFTSLVLYATEGVFFSANPPNWHQFLVSLSPMDAYESITAMLLEVEIGAVFGGGAGGGIEAAADAPFYLQDSFGFVILAAWALIPLAIGYWRFSRADLG